MTILEIILLILNIVLASLYITSKLKDNKNLASIVKEVKEDIKLSSEAVSDLVSKAKDIVFDETVQKNDQRVYHDCRRKESTG